MAASEARAAASEAELAPWTSALQALLIAERAALLSGRDEDFVSAVTMHYTSTRCGEVIGLAAAETGAATIRIWRQLAEVNGVFVRIPPKYGSRRTIDIAPFLRDLLAGHLAATSGRACSCDSSGGASACEETGHVFPGRPKDGPGRDSRAGVRQRRSGYAAWVFGPAASGWYPKRGSPLARPVPVTAAPWPGVPVRGRNAQGRAEACWLAILPGASLHSCRRGREICMSDHHGPKILRDLVVGHRTSGMEGVYAHVTPRAALVAADEADWMASLAARALISPCSPVPVLVLDSLLSPFRASRP